MRVPFVLAAFAPYGLVHLIAVLGSALTWWALLAWGRSVRRRRGAGGEQRWRRGLALTVWGVNLAWQGWLLRPSEFEWSHSLPLHLCDLAWMAAGWSLWSGGDPLRARHQVPVVWGLSLALLAYTSPAVTADPDGLSFWTFWITHAQISGVALLNLVVYGSRVTARGRWITLLATLAGCSVATAVNLLLDTSYFFTGSAAPANPSPIDWLGAWPLRALWTALLGGAFLWAFASLLMRLRPPPRPPF